MPTCKKCGRQHYNMQPCSAGVENERNAERERLMAGHNLTPDLHIPGWKPWRQEPMETVRLHGGLQVVKSGLKQTRDGWKEV